MATYFIVFFIPAIINVGYTKIMDSFGHEVMEFEKDKISFDNGFEIHTLPFEQGASTLVFSIHKKLCE